MSFELEWHPTALRNLEKLPKQTIKRVLDKFDQVVEEPFRYLEHYEGENLYKIRIGDYRALVEVQLENQTMFVRVFGHRGRVYK